MIEFIKNIWKICNSPGNDPIIIGLIIAFLSLLASSINNYISYRKVITEKDKRIEDLVKQRNKFQKILLKDKGGRLTTKQ